jgi:hypothetical protein
MYFASMRKKRRTLLTLIFFVTFFFCTGLEGQSVLFHSFSMEIPLATTNSEDIFSQDPDPSGEDQIIESNKPYLTEDAVTRISGIQLLSLDLNLCYSVWQPPKLFV